MLEMDDVITCLNGHNVAKVIVKPDEYSRIDSFLSFPYSTQQPLFGSFGRQIRCDECGATWRGSIESGEMSYTSYHTNRGWVYWGGIIPDDEYEIGWTEDQKLECRGIKKRVSKPTP